MINSVNWRASHDFLPPAHIVYDEGPNLIIRHFPDMVFQDLFDWYGHSTEQGIFLGVISEYWNTSRQLVSQLHAFPVVDTFYDTLGAFNASWVRDRPGIY